MSTPSTPNRWSLARALPMTEIELQAMMSEGKSLVSSLLLEPTVQLLLLAAGLSGLVRDSAYFYEGHSYIEYVLPGLLILQALRGFSRTMYRSVLDRQWGMLTIKRLAGAGALGYALSKIVAPMVALSAQITVMIGIAHAMGARYTLPHMLLGMALSVAAAAFWAAVAIVVTGFVKDYVMRDMIVTWMMLPLSLAAPVFYTVDTAPGYLQWIARVNPLAWQVQGVRDAILFGNLSMSSLVLTVLTGIAVVAAVYSVSWGDALTSEGGR